MIEKVIEIGTLFDFYGKLLSKRQFNIIESFYIHDLSLTEIAEELEISRQGVFDTLKRAESKLFEFENKLKLVDKFRKNYSDIDKIIELAEGIGEMLTNDSDDKNIKILKLIDSIKKLGYNILRNS